MNADRALEIITAWGGDARRWPDAERGAVLALAAGDGTIAAAIAEAQALDEQLHAWARDVVPIAGTASFDTAAITRTAPAAPGWQRWFGGGAVAAMVAAGFVIFGASQPQTMSAPRISMNSTVPTATVDGSTSGDADGFANVFTPTFDEDELI